MITSLSSPKEFKLLDSTESKKFIDQFNEMNLGVDAFKENVKLTDEGMINYLKTEEKAIKSGGMANATYTKYAKSVQTAGTVMDFAAIKAGLLNAALNAGIMLLASLAIEGIIELYDKYNVTLEENLAELDDLKSQYESVTSEVESLESQLDSIQQKMKDIEEKEPFEFTTDDEYQKLSDSNDELARRLTIQQELQKIAGKDAEEKAIETIGQESEDSIVNFKTYFNDVTGNRVKAEKITRDDAIYERIEAYKVLSAQIEELENKQNKLTQAGKTESKEYKKNASEILDLKSERDEYYNYVISTTDALDTEGDSIIEATEKGVKYKQNIDNLNTTVDDFISYAYKTDKSLSTTASAFDASTKSADSASNTITSLFSEANSSAIDDYQNSLSTLSGILNKLKTGSLSDSETIDLLQDFPELKEDTNNLSTAINDLIQSKLRTLIGTLKDAGANDDIVQLFKNITVSALDLNDVLSNNLSDTISNLSTVSIDLSSLDDAFATLSSGDTLDISDLSSLEKSFGNLDGFDDFIKSIGTATSVTNDVQSAFDNLLNTYIQSNGILDTVTEKNRDLVTSQLEQMGISNAEAIVNQTLANKSEILAIKKEYARLNGANLEDQTWQEISAFTSEVGASNYAIASLSQLALQKLTVNNEKLNFSSDIDQIISLATAANASTASLSALYAIQNIQDTGSFGNLTPEDKEQYLKLKEDTLESIKNGSYFTYDTLDADDFIKPVYSGTSSQDALNNIVKSNDDATKSETQFSEAIDWTTERIQILENSIDNLNAKLANTTLTENQISLYNQLIDKQSELMESYQESADSYKNQYSKALENSNLTSADVENITNGSYTMEQFSGTGEDSKDEVRYNAIQDAIELRDKIAEATTNISKNISEIKNYATELADIPWDKASNKVDKINGDIDLLNEQLNNAKSYEEKNEILDNILNKQKKIVSTYQDAVTQSESSRNSLYNKIDKKNRVNSKGEAVAVGQKISTAGITDPEEFTNIVKYNKEIDELAENTATLALEQEKLKGYESETSTEKYENDNAKIDSDLSKVENSKQDLENTLSEIETLDGQASEEQLNNLIALNSEEIEFYNQKKKLAEDALKAGDLSEEQIASYEQEVQDAEDAISDLTQENYELNESILELPIKVLEEANEELEKTLDSLNEIKDTYDTVINTVIDTLDDEIESIKEAQSEEEEYYDSLIDAANEELEALQDTNDEREKALELQQAQYELEKAKNQKTNRVYVEGEGFVYQADDDAVSEAQDTLDNLAYDAIIEAKEAEIDALEETKESALASYQEQIDELEEIKSAWESIVDNIEDAANIDLANNLFGDDWADGVLSGDTSYLDDITGWYESVSDKVSEIEDEIESNEEKIDAINDYIDTWKDAQTKIIEANNAIQKAVGDNTAELNSTDERAKTTAAYAAAWKTTDDNFNTAYNNIQKLIGDNTAELEATEARTLATTDYGDEWSNNETKVGTALTNIGLAQSTATETEYDLLQEALLNLQTFATNVEIILAGLSTAAGTVITELSNKLSSIKSLAAKIDSYSNTTSGSSGSSGTGTVINAGEHHSGMELGFIGDNTSETAKANTFRMLALDKLDSDEVPAVLQVGEAVLTSEQMDNIMSNMTGAYASGIGDGINSLLNTMNPGNSASQIAYNIGDVYVQGVDNTTDLAKEIKNTLYLRLNQELYK